MSKDTRFKPGKSGNPNGRPKGAVSPHIKSATWETLGRIVDLVFNRPESELKEYLERVDLSRAEKTILESSNKMTTLNMLLDRTLGKPFTTEIVVEINQEDFDPEFVE